MNKFEQYFNEYEMITKSESILIKEGLQSLNATKEKPIIFKKNKPITYSNYFNTNPEQVTITQIYLNQDIVTATLYCTNNKLELVDVDFFLTVFGSQYNLIKHLYSKIKK